MTDHTFEPALPALYRPASWHAAPSKRRRRFCTPAACAAGTAASTAPPSLGPAAPARRRSWRRRICTGRGAPDQRGRRLRRDLLLPTATCAASSARPFAGTSRQAGAHCPRTGRPDAGPPGAGAANINLVTLTHNTPQILPHWLLPWRTGCACRSCGTPAVTTPQALAPLDGVVTSTCRT